jgi:hypothetical protein
MGQCIAWASASLVMLLPSEQPITVKAMFRSHPGISTVILNNEPIDTNKLEPIRAAAGRCNQAAVNAPVSPIAKVSRRDLVEELSTILLLSQCLHRQMPDDFVAKQIARNF